MLALCLILLVTYHALNYAGIIGLLLYSRYVLGTSKINYNNFLYHWHVAD